MFHTYILYVTAMSRIVIIVMAIISVLGMAGCGLYQLKTEEEQPLEYTVVSEDNLPEMLKTMIEERKQTPFQLSYLEEDSLYMVQGYGEKEYRRLRYYSWEMCIG